jgi:hypothetical protein
MHSTIINVTYINVECIYAFSMNVFMPSSFFITESIEDPTIYRLKYFNVCF